MFLIRSDLGRFYGGNFFCTRERSLQKLVAPVEMGNVLAYVISYFKNDLVDIFLIVFIGTYYTVKELSLLQKLKNWISNIPQFEDQQSMQLLKSTRKDGFAAVITGGMLNVAVFSILTSSEWRTWFGNSKKFIRNWVYYHYGLQVKSKC